MVHRHNTLLRAAIFTAVSAFLAGASTASAQVISSVVAADATSDSVVISWTTDQPSSSLVNYGVTTGYGLSSSLNTALTTAHSVTLNGLTANTLYNFDVVSAAGDNATSTSSNFRFATLSLSPLIANINVIYITSTSATINWTTDQPSSALVNYGTTTVYGFSSPLTSSLSSYHTITLSGLAPSTTYNFNVVSAGLANAASTSANQTFTTVAASATAPTVGFVGSYGFTNSSAILTWPTDVPANTVLDYGTTTALGQLTPVQSTLTTSHQITLTGLNPGITYYFVAESTGSSGATGYSPIFSLTTTGPPSLFPAITAVSTSNLTTTSATLTWQTDAPSTTQVNYGTTPAYGSSSPLDSTLTTSHSVTLTGLTPGTNYDFQLVSVSTTGASFFGASMTGLTVWAWGDSLTEGYGDLTRNTYPLYLTTQIGVPVNNEGIGGTTSTQIAAAMLATPASFTAGNCNVIWSGANNHNAVSTVLADIASMVDALAQPACFLVMGDINDELSPKGTSDYNSIILTNQSLAAQYPNNYLNIRELLVQAYNPALTLDQQSYAEDIPAASLHAVRAQGTITSGALNTTSCAISVSNGTNGPGTVIIIDSETILINAIPDTIDITACTRGYNGTALASHLPNATYSLIDEVHLGSNGYDIVAQQVAAWFSAHLPLNFTTLTTFTPTNPVISAVTASSITTTSAVITWTTDQPATSLVNYGATSSYGASTTFNSTLTTTHSVALTGLTPNSVYNFDVVSANSSSMSSTSANSTFTTSTAAAPAISNVLATNLTATSVTITWTTGQPATAQVSYGTTPSYGALSPATTTLVTSQSVTLTGLTSGTTYDFAAISANGANQSTTSANYTFTTPTASATPPNVGYVAFWGVNNSGVTISWSTDLLANTELAYGTTTALGQLTPVQSAPTASHGVVLTGLTSGTTYYFVAQSTGANGATGYSNTYSFTTTGTPPTTPTPVITAVTATGITSTSATITWTTDQSSSSQVNYGATTSYGSSSLLNSSLTTTHSVTLTGLIPSTTYDYEVISTNSSSSTGTSTNYSFQTSAPVAAPPVISNIQTSAITSTSVTVTWTTDQASNSEVNYGATTAYGSTTGPDSNYVTSHSVTITGLTAGATYNFDVVSTTSGVFSSTSGNNTFSTTAANATPPAVGYLAFWGVNNSGVTISWSTDVLANTELAYGTTTALGQLTPVQATLTASHGVMLSGLNPGTTYYFVAESTGANGATGYSATYSFTTTGTAPVNPAPIITAVTTTNITNTTVTITWTTDQASTSQVNYGGTTSYGASSSLNTILTTSHSVTLTALIQGTIYNFDVVSANSSGVSATSANATFTTTGSAPAPVISAVTSSNVTSATATVTWTTDQAASSQVNYGLTTGYGSSSALATPLVTSHSVILTGLAPNTTYDFDVISANSANTPASSGNYTFTTQAASATPPALFDIAFWGITRSGVTIAWSTNVLSNTAVQYGTTAALGQLSQVQTALTNSHGITLTGLAASTTYYFVAQSADSNGTTGYSTTYSFTTEPGPPTISAITAIPATGNSATISWTTSVPTYSYVQFGTSSGTYNRYSVQTSLTAAPQCALGFVPSGTIYYQLVSTDANGNQAVSQEASFIEP